MKNWKWIVGIVAAWSIGLLIGVSGPETEPVAAEPEVITKTVTETVEVEVEPADVKESRERWQELATEQNTREDELDEREAELDEREAGTEEAETAPIVDESELTTSQEQAVGSAQDYLDYTHFSHSGLVGQLEYEGFPTEDAEFAVDSLDVDWMAQAVGSAQDYLDYTSFSRQGLIDQLEYEGFTTEQAEHGTTEAGL